MGIYVIKIQVTFFTCTFFTNKTYKLLVIIIIVLRIERHQIVEKMIKNLLLPKNDLNLC